MRLPIALLLLLTLAPFLSSGQNFAIGLDKTNILYAGIDNPLSIAATAVPTKSLVIKATLGQVYYQDNFYYFKSEVPGVTEITLYQKTNGHLRKIGSNHFRVNVIPDPIFKIASGKDSIKVVEFINQQYVRAELEGGFDSDIHFRVLKFTATIISKDSCRYKVIDNETSQISEILRSEFYKLVSMDIVIFSNILVSGMGRERIIKPRMFFLF